MYSIDYYFKAYLYNLMKVTSLNIAAFVLTLGRVFDCISRGINNG